MVHFFKKSVTTLILFFAFSNFSIAQEPAVTKAWTLQECIDYALKNNIQVKQNELNSELAKANLSQSKAAALPNLNGNANHFYNFGKTIDPFTNQFATDRVLSQNFSLSSSVTLFNGFQTYNTIQQNKYSYMASKYDVDKMKNDISLNVANFYMQVLFSQELLSIASNQVDVTNKQVDRTKKLVDAGSLAKGSLLDIQAQLATEEVNIANAQNQLDIAYLNLAQLLELESTTGFTIVKPELSMPAETVLNNNGSQILSDALTKQPEIKSAELNIKSSEKGVAIAQGGLSPRLTLSGSYGTGYSGISKRIVGNPYLIGFDTAYTAGGDYITNPIFGANYENIPFSDQINDNLNKSIGFNLTIPIFNGLQTKTSITRSKVALKNAQYNYELSKNQLEKNIQQALADANAALKKFSASQKAVEAIQQSFKYTEQRYEVGMLNAFDYNDAKNRLTKAQSDLLQAKYDFVFKTKVLDFYQGKPLTL